MVLMGLLSLGACNEDPKDGLYISVDKEIPIDTKVPAHLAIVQASGQDVLPIRIERRGGYSLSFEKHSYEIDLEEDLTFLGPSGR